jgi:glycine/D-amino acid oxidase-like deaminating enzyme
VSRIAIVGGGAAGSFAALLLARAGHQVVVLDKDRLEPAPDVEAAAASAFRASAPQIVQPHIVMAKCRQLLMERLPDVYDALLAAGVAEAPISTRMPLALALDCGVAEHVAPFYEDQAVVDAARLAMLRHTIFDAPAPAPPPADSERVGYAQLRSAAQFDPTAFRALWEVGGMIRRPDQVYADPNVVGCTLETLRRHRSAPPLAQPSRERLLAALARQ